MQIIAEIQVRHLGHVREEFWQALYSHGDSGRGSEVVFRGLCGCWLISFNQRLLGRYACAQTGAANTWWYLRLFCIVGTDPKLGYSNFLEAQLLTQRASGITESLLGCRWTLSSCEREVKFPELPEPTQASKVYSWTKPWGSLDLASKEVFCWDSLVGAGSNEAEEMGSTSEVFWGWKRLKTGKAA